MTTEVQGSKVQGPDVCTLDCERCARVICTGARSLDQIGTRERSLAGAVVDIIRTRTTCGANWHEVLERVRALCETELEAVASRSDQDKARAAERPDAQTEINRLLEGLELIAEMPAYDAELRLTVDQVVAQYEEARETARLTVDQFKRNRGEEVDRG